MLLLIVLADCHILTFYTGYYRQQLFRGTGLTSITLTEGITTLEYGTFANSKLTSIKLPKSLTQITSRSDGYYAGNLPNEYNNFQKSVYISDNQAVHSMVVKNWNPSISMVQY